MGGDARIVLVNARTDRGAEVGHTVDLIRRRYTGSAVQQLEAARRPVNLISKPYAIEDLAQTVRKVLDASEGGLT